MPGVSIRIFLVDGTPEGLRIVDKANWTGVAFVATRASWPSIKTRDEFGRPGVYVLVGAPEEAPEGAIYVGEADILRSRIDQHYAGKDFWIRLIAFASKDEFLNKAHIRYLESRLLALAQETKRARIENANAPSLPALGEAERADVENYLRDMLLIYPLVGVNAFEGAHIQPAKQLRLRLAAPVKGVMATGYDGPEGFVVHMDAVVSATEAAACPTHVRAIRKQLLQSGALVAKRTTPEVDSGFRVRLAEYGCRCGIGPQCEWSNGVEGRSRPDAEGDTGAHCWHALGASSFRPGK
jgi:hypothetical protein